MFWGTSVQGRDWQAASRAPRPEIVARLLPHCAALVAPCGWYELTAPGVALIWPAPALDRDGLLRAFSALIVACAVAALPRRWRVAGTAALVVALVFFALR